MAGRRRPRRRVGTDVKMARNFAAKIRSVVYGSAAHHGTVNANKLCTTIRKGIQYQDILTSKGSVIVQR